MRIDEVILHFLEGENEGVEIKLTPPRELYIGRSEESDIFLGEKKISRKHSMIQVEEDGIRISDLESTNGTFVNSQKISETTLKNGDRIKVGSSVIEVKIATKSKSAETSASKTKEKSEKIIPSKNQPEPSKSKAKRKEESTGPKLPGSAVDLGEDVEKKSKSKKLEEDSDLVVEYQTSVKEAKRVKELETSEKFHADAGKKEKSDEFDLNFDDVPEAGKEEPSFDRIPDLEDMQPDAEGDLELEEEPSQPPSSKPLMGDLSSMGLSDLIQNLHQNKKTGILTLNTSTASGKIILHEGALFDAESGKSKGVKAVYRMLAWKSGDFEFQPMSTDDKKLHTDQKPMEGSVENIIMEGFRQYDELRKIQKVLPQMEDELALEEHLDEPISKLHPKVLDVVQLVINHKKTKNVLDLSLLSDLETSKIIFYLIKKKIIRIKK